MLVCVPKDVLTSLGVQALHYVLMRGWPDFRQGMFAIFLASCVVLEMHRVDGHFQSVRRDPPGISTVSVPNLCDQTWTPLQVQILIDLSYPTIHSTSYLGLNSWTTGDHIHYNV